MQLSTSGIKILLEGIDLGTCGIKIFLQLFNLAKHRIQLVVHLTKTDRTKDSIPVGVTEGEDGTRAVGEDIEGWRLLGKHGDQAGGKRNSSNQGDNEAHLYGSER